MRSARLTIAGLFLVGSSAAAQTSLGSRIAAVRDGMVRMEYAARPGTCGNGKDIIAFRHAFFSRDMQSWGGRWQNVDCKPGGLRVALSVSAGEVQRIRMEVGGNWRPTDERVTDLGQVSSREVSAWIFANLTKFDGISDKDRVLLPAVLAADAQVIEPLKSIASNESRADHMRRQAVQWLGLVGDASVAGDLLRYAKSGDASGRKSLASAAMGALAQLDDDAGVPGLLELSRDAEQQIHHDAVFWLGQTSDPRALRRLHQVIGDGNESVNVRKNAIFALGQCDAAPTRDLVAVYKNANERSLQEQAIFVISQRDDNAATEALITIAKTDSDRQMRGKAMFWLAQKHEPRVTKLLTDILVK